MVDTPGETEKQRADLYRAVEYAETPARKAPAYLARSKARSENGGKTGALGDIPLAKN